MERAEFAALRTKMQATDDRTVEGQRTLAEQTIEQRADVKAIQASMERLEAQMERSAPP